MSDIAVMKISSCEEDEFDDEGKGMLGKVVKIRMENDDDPSLMKKFTFE